jgi:hypothetical protein
MTINCQLVTIVNAIAELQVDGLNMRDLKHIPESAIDSCPVFFPAPDGFVSNVTFTPQSFGSDSQRKLDLAYSLKYRFLYAPLGAGAFLQNYAGMITMLAEILEAIMGNSTPEGSVDMNLETLAVNAMVDPAGQNQYHGAEITLRVLEFAQ